jgi:hypothetical protein
MLSQTDNKAADRTRNTAEGRPPAAGVDGAIPQGVYRQAGLLNASLKAIAEIASHASVRGAPV